MAISRSDMERQLRKDGGILTIEDAKRMAPPGEDLAYINKDEAALLKSLGGAGEDINGTGIKSYFIKKLVRKAKKAVKKVVKSPIGKAAILGGLTFGVPGTGFKGFLGAGKGGGLGSFIKRKLIGTPLAGDVTSTGGPGILQKLGLIKGDPGSFGGLTRLGKIAGIGAASGLAGLLAAGEQEDEEGFDISKVDRGEGLNIADIVRRARLQDPEFRFLPGAEFTTAFAEGGGVESLAMNEEGVKQKFVSDEAGAIPKKMKDGEGGVLPSDMGKLKRSDFETEEDYQRYLRQLNRKASGGRALKNYSDDIVKEYKDNVKEGYTGSIRDYILEFYGPDYLKPMAQGGITELDAGAPDIKLEGDVKPENMKMARSNMMNKRRNALQDAFEMALEKYMINNNVDAVPIDIQEGIFNNLQRKMLGRAEGGLMNLGGMEMDLRGGGFVPIGAKEKADDVPARLSKNEFVMTADAVRAAGGGSIDKGADKMYKMMKNLEAQV